MIEIFQVIIQLFIFHLLFFFPITPYIAQRFSIFKNIDIYTLLIVNIIFHLLIYLIVSFLKINLKYFFVILIMSSCIFLIFNFKLNFQFFIKKMDKIFLFFLIINFCIFFSSTANPILGWDGVSHWIYKASAFYQDLGFVNVGATTYPHLPGFVWGFFWKNSIVDKEYVGRFFLIFFYVTSIFYSLNFFKEKVKDEYKILFIFLIIFLTYDKSLFGVYNDYYIFSLLIFCSGLLYCIFNGDNAERNSRLVYLILFHISSHLLLWTKQEGTFWSIILVAILIFFKRGVFNKIIHFFILLVSLSFFLILKYYFYKTIALAYNLSIYEALSSITFKNIIFNFSTITYYLFVSFFKYPIWLLIITFFTIVKVSKYQLRTYKIFLLFLLLNIIFLYLLMMHFALINQKDLFELVLRVSFDRIVLQPSGFYVILLILILNHNFKNSKKY